MLLAVDERIHLLNALPREGNITTVKIVRKLREALSFTEEEHKEFGLVVNPETGLIQWEIDKVRLVNVPIGEKAMDIIRFAMKKMDEKGLLQEVHIPLWEKFMEGDAT